MRKSSLLTVVAVLCLSMSLSSCSITRTIPAALYKDYRTELKKNNLVRNTKLTFLRPRLTISVSLNVKEGANAENEIARILEATKAYVTVDNMSVIAKYVRWPEEIWTVTLEVTDVSSKSIFAKYRASYFASRDAYDQSSVVIDGYKTWEEVGY